MERHGFNPSRFETSDTESDGSEKKDKDSSKKKSKSSFELAQPIAEDKKEQTVERTKGLLDKLIRPEQKAAEPKAEEAEAREKRAPEAEQTAAAEMADEIDEAHVETLTSDEQAAVVAAYVPARIAELKAGRSESEDEADAAAREADIEYLESLAGEVQETAEVGAQEELVELSNETPEAGMPLAEADEPVEHEFSDDEPVRPSSTQAAGPTTIPPAPTPAASGSSQGGSRGSGGALPPLSPRPFGVGPSGPLHNTAPNLAPVPPRQEYVPDYRENPNATYLLVGGIVGYLIGRRRGRIKTEKRLAVVQRKLENQIAEVQSQVAQKEAEVQKLARERYWQQKAERPPLVSKAATPEQSPARPAVAPLPERPVTIRERERTFQERPERPGAENMPRPLTAASSERVAGRPESHVEARPVKEFTKKELLETGEKIKVGNTNLRRIFEAKLITESGLKRLVYEHLEHGDIRRGLAREFLAKELSYERDPRLRDLLPPEMRGASGDTAAKAGTRQMAQDDASSNSAPNRTDIPAVPAANVSQQKSVKQSRGIPTGLLTALTLIALALALYAVLLSLRR